jgi:uncharacterized membrane protein
MKNNDELMLSAKDALTGKWGIAVLAYIIVILINIPVQIAAEYSQFAIVISLILGGPIAFGTAIFHLKLSRGQEAKIDDIFEGFGDFASAIETYLIMVLIIIFSTFLFIIPGIIAAISYSMTFYIMAEDSSIKGLDALNKSKELMYGHKMQYAEIVLRIIVLALLCLLTLGIGFLFLVPYIKVLNAKFYDEIK